MEEIEAKIKQQFVGNRIENFEFYNVNNYYVIEENKSWVIDAGVQINFKDSHFTLAWDRNGGGFDVSQEKTAIDLLDTLDYFQIPNEEISETIGLKALIGNKIENVALKFHYYEDLDDEGFPIESKTFVPVSLLISFENKEKLTLSIVHYELILDPFEFKEFSYGLDGQMHIGLNSNLEIIDYLNE